MNIFYYKKTHIDIPKFWKNIFKMTIPVFIGYLIGLIIKKIIPIENNLALVFQILIYIILYAFIMWKFGTNQYEKNLFIKPIKGIMKKLRKNQS